MNRHAIFGVLAALASCVLTTGSVWADAVSSPGKTSAAMSACGNIDQLNVSAQIEKGKRKRMLLVTAAVNSGNQWFEPISIAAAVNGVGMEPGYLLNSCNGFCSPTGTFWLDLDIAESENPGLFVNVPLNVTLYTEMTGSGCASVSATLLKK